MAKENFIGIPANISGNFSLRFILRKSKNVALKLMALGLFLTLLTSCSTTKQTQIETAQQEHDTFFKGRTTTVWNKLQSVPEETLALMQGKVTDPKQAGWLKLAIISKQKSADVNLRTKALLAWQKEYPNHPAQGLIPKEPYLVKLLYETTPKKIAVLLPKTGTFAASARVVQEGLLSAYYGNRKEKEQVIQFYDTETDTIDNIYKLAKEEGADFIIGPLLKDKVKELAGKRKFDIPILALNYTEVGLLGLPNNFYEFGLLPEDEVDQIVQHANQKKLTRALVIAPNTAWGKRMVHAFDSKWRGLGNQTQNTLLFSNTTNFKHAIATLLNVDEEKDKLLSKKDNDKDALMSQRRQDFDVIFLFSQPVNARKILPLLKYYYANNIPIYSTSAIFNNKREPGKDTDLNGVIICDIPWGSNNSKNPTKDRLFAVGQDAYLLSQSLENLKTLPDLPIYGRTGALTLSYKQIHRRIPCVPIKNNEIPV